MARAIRIHAYGGPEEMRVEDVPVGDPGPGEVRIRHGAIGVNFADLHHRSGRYPLPSLPHVLGGEGAGTIEAVGPDVTEFTPGDRVAYSGGGPALPPGSYAEGRIMGTELLVPLPDEIDDQTAAAMITKGLTAHYLLFDVHPVAAGETILVHAAAGGVGVILCQWARHLGATVIGVVGSDAKAETARENGCAHVIVSDREDIVARTRELTDGEGVPVVYDSVGRDTFEASLRCLSPHGLLASYGSASGPVPPFDLFELNKLGSLYVTSAAFYWHLRTRDALLARAADLIDVVRAGNVKVRINQRYDLDEAAAAHVAMESRATSGMTVLIP